MTLGCYVSHIAIMGFCYYKVKVKSDSVLKSLRSKQAFCVDDAVKVNRFRAEEKVTLVRFINIINLLFRSIKHKREAHI